MTVTFPPGTWIPDVDALARIGLAVLDVAGAALDLYADGKSYERRVVAHGSVVPVPKSGVNQLAVCLPQIALGKAGRQQYQFPDGEPGQFGFHFARYSVVVTRSWPTITGGLTGSLPSPEAQADALEMLWRDGYVVWASLRALALGGVLHDQLSPVGVGQMMVGPMVARGPLGTRASWVTEMEVQLP